MYVQPSRPAIPQRATPAGRATGTAAAAEQPAADGAASEERLANAIADALAKNPPTAGDVALEERREAFDFMLRVRAEAERETNALRELAVEQAKHEDEFMRKWIAMI